MNTVIVMNQTFGLGVYPGLNAPPPSTTSPTNSKPRGGGHSQRGAKARVHTRFARWANAIFHRAPAPALETIWRWLERKGLERSANDTHPLTDWLRAGNAPAEGRLFMAGSFGQWKYFWPDGCVRCGRQLGLALRKRSG